MNKYGSNFWFHEATKPYYEKLIWEVNNFANFKNTQQKATSKSEYAISDLLQLQ